MKSENYPSDCDKDKLFENDPEDQKSVRYRLWIKKVREVKEMNQAYFRSIHPEREVLCA